MKCDRTGMTSTHTSTPTRTDGLRTARRVEIRAFGAPENLRVAVGPAAGTPPSGHARVRVLASSLTLSDSIVRRGLNPYTSHLARPFTLGYALVGVVEETGVEESGVEETGVGDGSAVGVAAGDLVADLTRWGANADSVIRPTTSLTRIVTDVDPVLLEPLVMTGVTAYQALTRVAHVTVGQTVLVHGATGGVGLLMTGLARHLGARVLATGSPAKHDALRAAGATPLDGRATDLDDRVRALAPDGVDAVFDGVGGPSRAVVARALSATGTFVGFGFAGPAGQIAAVTPETLDDTARVLAEGRAILDELSRSGRTAVEFEVGTARDEDRAAYDEDLHTLAVLVADGSLHPQVRAVGVDDVVAAHRQIDAGSVTGRLVLDHRIDRA